MLVVLGFAQQTSLADVDNATALHNLGILTHGRFVRPTWEGAGMAPGQHCVVCARDIFPQVSPLLRFFHFLIVVLVLSFLLNHLPSCSVVCRHLVRPILIARSPQGRFARLSTLSLTNLPGTQSSTTPRLFPSVKDTMQYPSPMNLDEISTLDQWHFKTAKPFQYSPWVLC